MSKLVPIKVLDTYVVIDISSREVVDVSRPMYHKLFRETKFANEMATLLVEKDQRIKELEEQLANAIVPKFRVGQKIWYIEDGEIESTIIDDMWIEYCGETEPYFNLYLHDGLGLTSNSNNEKWSPHFGVGEYYVFATEAEAEEKLKELQDAN